MRFVDTSILLYAIREDPAERRKAGIAIEILDSPIGELGRAPWPIGSLDYIEH